LQLTHLDHLTYNYYGFVTYKHVPNHQDYLGNVVFQHIVKGTMFPFTSNLTLLTKINRTKLRSPAGYSAKWTNH